MFEVASALILILWPNIITAYHRRSKPKFCKYKVRDTNFDYNYTWKIATCPNSWCCSNGCCPWYLNLTICIFLVVCVFCLIKIIEALYDKFCNKAAPENPENIAMSQTYLNAGYSRDSFYQNYGSAPPADPAPSYEEVMKQRNQ